MISAENVSLAFSGKPLFENVDIKFTPGNCYGLIGANGAGKSSFMKILAGELETSAGRIVVEGSQRINVLRQDHFAYDDEVVLNTVMMGHAHLYEIMQAKDAIYAKPDFSDEDGIKAAELEGEFADMDGWNAEPNAAMLLSSLGIVEAKHQLTMKELDDDEKVRVLLAQALFGEPDILLLDEPTNHLDVDSILWLEDFLLNFKNTVIVISHDRHFLDRVCTHIADVDFQKVRLFSGNYTFWYETSQLALRQRQSANQKKIDKMKELQAFIQRFSANASKSRQASSRKALLSKITLDDIKPSTRKYPYIVFKPERKLGKEVLFVDGISKTVDGVVLFKDLRFSLARGEKMAVVGSDNATTMLMQVLAGEVEPDEGNIKWGRSVNRAYYPKDNTDYFTTDVNLIAWMRMYSENQEEHFVRSFLGRMLFTGEDSKKSATVLSGGEKVRCMIARMMLQDPNMLMLDGPTNHLDLESITALNNGLIDFEGSVIVCSHDVQFNQTLVSRVLELDGEDYYDLGMEYEEYLADSKRVARLEARQEREKR
ncbi:MAG: ABC-F family ATP-binding cassette domain-containing protein [Sandaracinaceae bacterium]